MIYKLNMCLVGDIDILVYLMHCSRQYQSVNLSAQTPNLHDLDPLSSDDLKVNSDNGMPYGRA